MANKILMVCLSIVIIMSSIAIGGPLNSNIKVINSIITIVAILYILWNKIKEKKKIITNEMDIFVIIFMLSTCVPLLFNTYISLEDTVLSIFQNISVVAVYFLVKQLNIENQEKSNIIAKIIAVAGIIIFIIGIDNLTSNFLGQSLNSIGILNFANAEDRMIANLGYANSTAIIFAVCSFLTIGLSLKNDKNISKPIYGMLNFCYMVGIGLTESKATILCFIIFFIIYIILQKKKSEKTETILGMMTSIIVASIYIIVFERARTLENYGELWLFIPIFGLINGLLWIFINNVKDIFNKITKKQMIVAIIVFIIIISGLFIFVLCQTEKLVLFTTTMGTDEVEHYTYNIKGNSECNMIFDINAKTNSKKGYIIYVDEKNRYSQTIEEHLIEIENFEGKKYLNFITDEDTERLNIRFVRQEKEENANLTINKLTLNSKEIVLKYRYLPSGLVDIIKKINIKNRSVWERGVFILDSIQIAKENFWLGIGGNGWRYTYGMVQQYDYHATQAHCFYTQVIIENGILGGIGILGVVICIIIYAIKQLKEQRSITYLIFFCSIGTLLLHSAVDFDMSFFYIKLIAFIVIRHIVIISKKRSLRKMQTDTNIYRNTINYIFTRFILWKYNIKYCRNDN